MDNGEIKRYHHISKGIVSLRGIFRNNRRVRIAQTGSSNWQLCFQCLSLLFNSTVKKDVEIGPVTEVTARGLAP
jgi:hypothetical protein